MDKFDRKKHWDKIYRTKSSDAVSWYQPTPETSLEFVREAGLTGSAKIIDIGGGDSQFARNLLTLGYRDITVLDVSINALDKARQKLGGLADKVKWVHADITEFSPTEFYDFWHDRAAFHFLTGDADIESYLATAKACMNPGAYLVIGTFSEEGPEICSGIRIRQYSEDKMTGLLSDAFRKVRCIKTDHKTPSGSIQNFLFCSFSKT